MFKIFPVVFFVTCLYYLGRTPLPFFNKKLLVLESKQNNEFSKKGKKRSRYVTKPLINILFNYKRWKRPFRYIKNNEFENMVKNEISEFFFHTYQRDGPQPLKENSKKQDPTQGKLTQRNFHHLDDHEEFPHLLTSIN